MLGDDVGPHVDRSKHMYELHGYVILAIPNCVGCKQYLDPDTMMNVLVEGDAIYVGSQKIPKFLVFCCPGCMPEIDKCENLFKNIRFLMAEFPYVILL